MWLQRRVGGGGEVRTEGTSNIQRLPPAPPRVAVWVPLSRKADCQAMQIRLERISEEVSVQGPVTTCFFRKLCHRTSFLQPVKSADDPDGVFSILEAAKVGWLVYAYRYTYFHTHHYYCPVSLARALHCSF